MWNGNRHENQGQSSADYSGDTTDVIRQIKTLGYGLALDIQSRIDIRAQLPAPRPAVRTTCTDSARSRQ